MSLFNDWSTANLQVEEEPAVRYYALPQLSDEDQYLVTRYCTCRFAYVGMTASAATLCREAMLKRVFRRVDIGFPGREPIVRSMGAASMSNTGVRSYRVEVEFNEKDEVPYHGELPSDLSTLFPIASARKYYEEGDTPSPYDFMTLYRAHPKDDKPYFEGKIYLSNYPDEWLSVQFRATDDPDEPWVDVGDFKATLFGNGEFHLTFQDLSFNLGDRVRLRTSLGLVSNAVVYGLR